MKVFIDTCVVRYSQKPYTELRKFREEVMFNGKMQEIDICRPVEMNPLRKLSDPKHKNTYLEALACSQIEEFAKDGIVSLVWGIETFMETVLNSPFREQRPTIIPYIEAIESPVQYSRSMDPAIVLDFFRGISDPTFEKWQKALGVVEGSKREQNQLMDAFHLWTAEHHNCECFVTADFKMIKSISSSKINTSMQIFKPTELIEFISTNQ